MRPLDLAVAATVLFAAAGAQAAASLPTTDPHPAQVRRDHAAVRTHARPTRVQVPKRTDAEAASPCDKRQDVDACVTVRGVVWPSLVRQG